MFNLHCTPSFNECWVGTKPEPQYMDWLRYQRTDRTGILYHLGQILPHTNSRYQCWSGINLFWYQLVMVLALLKIIDSSLVPVLAILNVL